jgi:hypothetical protein
MDVPLYRFMRVFYLWKDRALSAVFETLDLTVVDFS